MSLDPHNKTVRLREEHLLPEGSGCPVCGALATRRVGSLQSSPAIDLICCPNCRITYASRLPLPETLEEFYKNYYGPTPEVWTTAYAAGFAGHLFKHMRKGFAAVGTLRILDFGGGDGSIAILLGEAFQRAGLATSVEVALVDYNTREREMPPGFRLRRFRELSQLDSADVFEIVLASAILEHLPNPNEVLRALLERLAPGGLFYARTPFMLGFHRIFAMLGRRSPIPYPFHLYDMGRDYWDRALETLSLQRGYRLRRSAAAYVETNPWSSRWWLALLAYLLKLPSRIPWLRSRYDFVGGWEAVIERSS